MTPSVRKKRATKEPGAVILTPRQVEILKLIRAGRDSNGYSPTMQEIAEKLDISKVTVFEHVESLIRKGLLHRQPNRARSLILDRRVKLRDEMEQSSRKADLPREVEEEERAGVYGIRGKVAAGYPVEAYENPDLLDLAHLFGSPEDTFVLQVRGDSMIEEQIRDGDYVLVKRTRQASEGQMVVALLEDGETTLKKFYYAKEGICLMPCNPDYEPIYADKVLIQGVVIGVVRCV